LHRGHAVARRLKDACAGRLKGVPSKKHNGANRRAHPFLFALIKHLEIAVPVGSRRLCNKGEKTAVDVVYKARAGSVVRNHP
jgi:hypothetical protein